MNNSESDVLVAKCKKMLAEFNIVKGARIVVGVSGGADSVCLLHSLYTLKDEYGYSLIAAHIDHGIRGAEAHRDRDFTKTFCESLGVDFKLCTADCITEAKVTGETVEECGRRIRYSFFDSLCTGENDRIATAHNANDNAETVLFNITRGSALKGASGIPHTRGRIIRPLINCTRAEIEEYCKKNELSFVTDSTNLSDDYTRNRIRHKVLPELSSINASAVEAFSRFSDSARADSDFLDSLAQNAFIEAKIGDNTYNADYIASLNKALSTRVLKLAVQGFSGVSPDSVKLTELSGLCENGGKIQLYKNCFASSANGKIKFFTEEANVLPPEKIPLVPGEFIHNFGDTTVKCVKYTNNSKKVHHLLLDNLVDYDRISGNLILRSRVEGDFITLTRRKVTKSLKKLFNEASIPGEERAFVPVIADDCGVVWVYGFGTDKRCLPSKDSQNVYLLEGEKYGR